MSHNRRYEEFLGSLKSLLESGKHSDFVITCGPDTYNVHKSIVCSQCEFFDAASRFGKEGEEGKVDLVEDEPEIVKYLVQYLYQLDYHVPSEDIDGPWIFRMKWNSGHYNPKVRWEADHACWKLSKINMPSFLKSYPDLKANNSSKVIELDRDSPEHRKILASLRIKDWHIRDVLDALPNPPVAEDLKVHAEVYALAEKYNVKGLKDLAREKFKQSLEYSFPDIEFFEMVDMVFTTTPETDYGLRLLVAFTLHKQKELYGMHALLARALESIPALAYHVLCHEYAHFDNPSISAVPGPSIV